VGKEGKERKYERWPWSAPFTETRWKIVWAWIKGRRGRRNVEVENLMVTVVRE
jgi:hypothetical protein